MKNTISGFSGLRSLIEQQDKKTTESTIKVAPIVVNYKYPLQFKEIKRRFGGNYDLFNNLQRGVAVLSNDDELAQYLFSYGNMHEAKLIEAYKNLFEYLSVSNNEQIEILDYACGQGLASIVLLNCIETNFNYSLSNLLKIILIEPSSVALERAKLLLNESSDVYCVNKYLDDVIESNLKTYDKSLKIHLFSNILDMGDTHFNMQNLANTILQSQDGINYFVCVSALNKDKINFFMRIFERYNGFKEIASFDGNFTNQQQWQIKFNIFKVGV